MIVVAAVSLHFAYLKKKKKIEVLRDVRNSKSRKHDKRKRKRSDSVL